MSWTERFSAPVGLANRRLALFCVALAALVLIGQGLVLPLGEAISGALLVSILVWASAVDIERHILPNALVIPLIAAGLIRAGLDYPGVAPIFADAAIGAAAGYGFLAAFALIYRACRGVDGLGFGDVKLFSVVGAWTGWMGLPPVMLLAASLALLSYVVRFLTGDRQWRHRAIAFGPFIAAALWMFWLHGAWQAR